MKIDKETIEKYVPESLSLVGPACIIASEKAMKNRNECVAKAYSNLEIAYNDYKKRVEYNNKWYVRFCRFIRNLFN